MRPLVLRALAFFLGVSGTSVVAQGPLLTVASGITVAGYYTGRQLDTRVWVIRVVPDRPQP